MDLRLFGFGLLLCTVACRSESLKLDQWPPPRDPAPASERIAVDVDLGDDLDPELTRVTLFQDGDAATVELPGGSVVEGRAIVGVDETGAVRNSFLWTDTGAWTQDETVAARVSGFRSETPVDGDAAIDLPDAPPEGARYVLVAWHDDDGDDDLSLGAEPARAVSCAGAPVQEIVIEESLGEIWWSVHVLDEDGAPVYLDPAELDDCAVTLER